MRRLITLLSILIFICTATYAQKLQCGCKADSSSYSIEDCKVINLKNGSKLYYQVNCDSVWLTLENVKGNKKVIYSMSGSDYKELGNLNYRLGYQFAREYKRYLLFRSGCPANGPCNFILVNKYTGRKYKELGELVYQHDSVESTNPVGVFYDFLISLDGGIWLYYPNSGKEYYYKINTNEIKGIIPEYQFNSVQVNKHYLILKYSGLKTERTIKLKLRE